MAGKRPTRAAELRALCAWVQAKNGYSQEHSEVLVTAIFLHLGAAREAAEGPNSAKNGSACLVCRALHRGSTVWGSRMSHIPRTSGDRCRPQVRLIASVSLRLLCLIFQHMLGLALLTGRASSTEGHRTAGPASRGDGAPSSPGGLDLVVISP